MSNGSKKSSASKKKAMNERAVDLQKQLPEEILHRAKQIANNYSVILQPHERLGFTGRAVEMPTVFADGSTERKCVQAMREALMVAVAVMLQAGQVPPASMSEQRRQTQVNVRLTAEEKLLLEETAKRRGYRGLSDFLRAVAMAETRRCA